MKPDIRDLARRRLILYDGGMGTMLFAAGLVDGESPEPWNWEKPEVVSAIYRAYYEAGSDVVQTNTFGGTAIKLSEVNLENRVHDANYLAARALVQVRPEGRYAAGDVGPTGKFMQPMGEYTRDQFQATFEAQVAGLVDERQQDRGLRSVGNQPPDLSDSRPHTVLTVERLHFG